MHMYFRFYLNTISLQRIQQPKLPGEGLTYKAAIRQLEGTDRISLDQVARMYASLSDRQRTIKDMLKQQQRTLDLILGQLRDTDGMMKVKQPCCTVWLKDSQYILSLI